MQAALDTVIIFSTRAERLASFYAAVFDLGEPEVSTGHFGLRAGSVYLGIDQVDEEHGGSSSVSLWFRVEDVDATFDRLVEVGAHVIYAPVDKPWGQRLTALRDLDGNRIGLSQPS